MNEYRLIDHGDGRFDILTPDGRQLPIEFARSVAEQVYKSFEVKSYIYFAKHKTNVGWFKIGVSNDFQRRESQLNVVMFHWVQCSPITVFKIEKALHKAFRPFHVQDEWFCAPDTDTGLEQMKSIRTEQQLVELARRLDDKVAEFETQHSRDQAARLER